MTQCGHRSLVGGASTDAGELRVVHAGEYEPGLSQRDLTSGGVVPELMPVVGVRLVEGRSGSTLLTQSCVPTHVSGQRPPVVLMKVPVT